MEIKKFDEYTKEEQVKLLCHWWHYYGKLPVTEEDIAKFEKLVNDDPMYVKNAALIAYARGEGPQGLVKTMRGDMFYEFYEILSTLKFANTEDDVEKRFIEEIVHTYNNPEPPVPMSSEQIVEFLQRLVGTGVGNYTMASMSVEELIKEFETKSSLTCDNVREIYSECLLRNDEIINGQPMVDFTVGEGVRQLGVFNSERLARQKEKVASMVDEITDIEKGVSFLNVHTDKSGRQWTDDQETVDLLVQLGVATETLYYPVYRDMWAILPGQVPLVMRNREKDNESLRTHKPKEFMKVVNDVHRGVYRKDTEN